MPRTIIPRRTKSLDPGSLASELASAEQTREQRVAQAESDWLAARSDVIERGSQRANDLRRLEQEARVEREAIEDVLKSA